MRWERFASSQEDVNETSFCIASGTASQAGDVEAEIWGGAKRREPLVSGPWRDTKVGWGRLCWVWASSGLATVGIPEVRVMAMVTAMADPEVRATVTAMATATLTEVLAMATATETKREGAWAAATAISAGAPAMATEMVMRAAVMKAAPGELLTPAQTSPATSPRLARAPLPP